MERKELPSVTIILADTRNYGQAVHSLKNSLSKVKPARAIFFTDIDYAPDIEGLEVIKIAPLNSKDDYSKFIMYELYKYLTTDFVLITQWDGTIEDPEAWDDEFLNYDVTAPAWLYEDGRNCGCGGFSLRSRRLMEVVGTDPLIQVSSPEDAAIGRLYRKYLEELYYIQFAPDDVCDRFGFELRAPIQSVFGKHGFFHESYRPWVVISRKAAMGDVVALEPVLEYYHSKKYNVVLDTLPQFFNLFGQHYFKIHHPDEVDRRVLSTAKVINLDMAYEVNPKQNHLKSYFEMCGILDYKLRNPKLKLHFDPKLPSNKLFKKYCVVHIDKRESKQGRNVYGLNWYKIVDVLESSGYDVVQVGMGEARDIGTIRINTPNEMFLLWVLGSADLFLGIDSGLANISVAMGTPAIIFFGSVTPEHIYPDLANIKVIQHTACETPKCWSSKITTEGVACVVDENMPPCTIYDTDSVIKKIQEVINPV